MKKEKKVRIKEIKLEGLPEFVKQKDVYYLATKINEIIKVINSR